MNPDPDKPWMAYQDVVDNLVRPPLDEARELVQKSLDEYAKLLQDLKSEQRNSAELLTRVHKDQTGFTQQLPGLRTDNQGFLDQLSSLRNEQRQLGVELAGRLERVEHLRSAVEAQYVLTRELSDAVEALRREHTQAHQRVAALESHLTDPRAAAARHRPTSIIGILSGTTLALVIADVLARLL